MYDDRTIGVISSYPVSKIINTTIITPSNERRTLSPELFKKLKPTKGDTVFFFTNNHVGILPQTDVIQFKRAPENQRFDHGRVRAYRSAIDAKYWIRVVLVDAVPFWIPAYKLDQIEVGYAKSA